MIHRVFGKAAIGAEAVGAMALTRETVVQAGRIHSLATTPAAAAPCVDLDGDPVAGLIFIDRRSQLHHRAIYS
jgi:hypothetical protein